MANTKKTNAKSTTRNCSSKKSTNGTECKTKNRTQSKKTVNVK